MEVSRQITSVCIHVERVVGLIKNRYEMLDCVLPLTLLKTIFEGAACEIANIDKLFTVSTVLVNLNPVSANPTKWSTHSSNSSAKADELFECV